MPSPDRRAVLGGHAASFASIDALAEEALAMLRPPPRLPLSQWAERHFRLVDESSAKPGRFRLWPYQREMMDAMGDPSLERVTVIKSARIGYSKALFASIAAAAANNPCAMILLVPRDEDCRRVAVEEIEPAFDQSPTLRGLIETSRIDGRNTLTRKSIVGGGSIKILAARSPANLRSHDAKMLFIDEEDGMELTSEGDPISIAIMRTFAHADRKIIRGSTPRDEHTSTIAKAYDQSDRRVFEIPCPHCGVFFELMWNHIVWRKGEPSSAAAACPNCNKLIAESSKIQMAAAGQWRATRPDVVGHAGFRLNTLISPLPNASWPKLIEQFESARGSGPAEMQVFVNTVLGQPWKTSLDAIDERQLRDRVEDFGLIPSAAGENRFPADVFLVLAAVDTQDDRFEIGFWGFNEIEAFFLAHEVIWGDPADSVTQDELDKLLKSSWQHPNGWRIGIEAAAIDSQGHKTQAVYDFCAPRLARKIYPIISRPGPRKIWAPAKGKTKDKVRLFIVGHDEAKTIILQRMVIPPLDEKGDPSPGRFRYSQDLPSESFEQLTAEKRVVRYVRNRAVVEFRPKSPGLRNEALDMACYAMALRHSLRINFVERRARRGSDPVARKSIAAMLAH